MHERQGDLSDTSPEEFRRQLHELADWVADFRQSLGSLPVAHELAASAARQVEMATEGTPAVIVAVAADSRSMMAFE